MGEFTKLLEQAGFSVTNADDYQNIEIRDLKNNNELLQKNAFNALSEMFRGSSDRFIWFITEGIQIYCGNGLFINKYLRRDEKTEYRIQATLSDRTTGLIELSVSSSKLPVRNNGIIKVRLSQRNRENQILFSKNLLIRHSVLDTSIDTFSEFTGEKSNMTFSIESCHVDLYINTIMSFFNDTQLISDNPKLKEGSNIVLSSIREDIDKIFANHRANIEKYIEILEKDKVEVTKEYQAKINGIDSNIERLRNLSQTQNKVK